MATLNRMARDPKLEAVLARLCEKRGGKIWKTQAVKLPYLVDLIGAHVLGHKITQTKHEAWDMGVVATSAWNLVEHRRGGKYFFTEEADYSQDARRLVVREKPQVQLSEDEIAIIDFVAEHYGELENDQLMALTKLLNPSVAKWGGPPSAEVVETKDAYQRLPLWFGELEADAEAASQAIKRIEADPARLLRGQAAEAFLDELIH